MTLSENKCYLDGSAAFEELYEICSHLLVAVRESYFSFQGNDYRELFANARWVKYTSVSNLNLAICCNAEQFCRRKVTVPQDINSSEMPLSTLLSLPVRMSADFHTEAIILCFSKQKTVWNSFH